MNESKVDDKNYRMLVGGIAVIVLLIVFWSGYVMLRKPVGIDQSDVGQDVPNNIEVTNADSREKEMLSEDLWRTMNQGQKIPGYLGNYVSGLDYMGMRVYLSDLVEIYDQMFLIGENNEQSLQDQNVERNWLRVMSEAKRRLVLGQIAREMGLIDVSNMPVFGDEQYQQWRERSSRKYVMKMWEVEVSTNSEITAEQVGQALVSLAENAKTITSDEDLTQGIMGLFGEWNMDGSSVKSAIEEQDVAVWLDESYVRLLSSLVTSDTGDWSTIIEVPSTSGKVKYVMGYVAQIESDNAALDGYLDSIISQYPDLDS